MPQKDVHRAAVARALKFINAQDAFCVLGAPEATDSGGTHVEIGVKLDLLIHWISAGQSPNGVLVEEPVTMVFPAAFPLKAPKIFLREGFDCSLAHVSPTGPGQRGEPCLIFGNLDEFHQREGMAGILNQLKLWLENAARGTLISPNHGWEPTWRNACSDILVADAAFLRQVVDQSPRGGTAWFRLDYFEYEGRQAGQPFRRVEAQLQKKQISLNEQTLPSVLEKRRLSQDQRFAIGRSLGLLVWPKAFHGHQPVTANRYTPEMVTDRSGLQARAREFRCEDKLNSAFSWLARLMASKLSGGIWPLVVVLCARRPFNLIQCDSPLELCPYVLEFHTGMAFPKAAKTQVRPAGHRQMISHALLQQMSGLDPVETPRRWIQIGCGSLGSKIAVHLARAGWAPSDVVDSGSLGPHNAARHALLPPSSIGDHLWAGPKSNALAEALKGLGSAPVPHLHDVATEISDPKARVHLLPLGAWMAVNATASLCVREALGSVPYEDGAPRVVEATLFSDGQYGALTVEGPARNPNTLDLQAYLYDLARTTPGLKDRFFARGPRTGRQVVGEGCGSETMVMSDARVSMFAASMAENLLVHQRRNLPAEGGILHFGSLGQDGLSLAWQSHQVAQVVEVIPEGSSGWSLRISAQADERIREEVARWPHVETGGILVGRHSEVARAFYVTGILPAPPDSHRSATQFMLGIRNLEMDLATFSRECNEGLYFLGTWHSHLLPSGPSGTDRTTARLLAETRLVPSVMLIHTPTGYRAILADSIKT